VKAMTIDEAKKLLPPELKYPLPDDVIDNLINVQAIPLQFDFDEDGNNNKGMHYAMMAALIELKERREREDKELEERSLEIERDDWEREE
jgi:hypothetical protein